METIQYIYDTARRRYQQTFYQLLSNHYAFCQTLWTFLNKDVFSGSQFQATDSENLSRVLFLKSFLIDCRRLVMIHQRTEFFKADATSLCRKMKPKVSH